MRDPINRLTLEVSWPLISAGLSALAMGAASAFGFGRAQQKTQSMLKGLHDDIKELKKSQMAHMKITNENTRAIAHLTGRMDGS